MAKITVKLNNPLMGTETLLFKRRLNYEQDSVKLNNPLMGTETNIHTRNITKMCAYMLN